MSKYKTVESINLNKPIGSRLEVIKLLDSVRDKNNIPRKMVLCKCNCGNERDVRLCYFLTTVVSCGCTRKEFYNKIKGTFRYKYHPKLRACYSSMISRCYKPTDISYKNYGKKGVEVCVEWLNSFKTFGDWALENGWREGLQLDKDLRGNGLLYSPATCCFLTRLENSKLRTCIKKYNYENELMSLSEISEKYSYPFKRLYERVVYRKLSVSDALTEPVKPNFKRFINSMKLIPVPEMQSLEYKDKIKKALMIIEQISAL